MISFQFDQCFSDKKIIQACEKQGLAEARPLPKSMCGLPDPELLAIVLASDAPFVTLDRALPFEHTNHIPTNNPGIIVVCYSRGNPRTITTRNAAKILSNFKDIFPIWNDISVKNSIVEITERSIEVRHVENGKLRTDHYAEFADAEPWQANVIDCLARNGSLAFEE